MEINKYAISRICCLDKNIEVFADSPVLIESIGYLNQENDEIYIKKENIKNQIENSFFKASNSVEKNILTNIRRSLNNNKRINIKDYKKLSKKFEPLEQLIIDYQKTIDQLDKRILNFESLYQKIYVQKKLDAKSILKNDIFINGLQLSSLDLFNSYTKWEACKNNKKSRQTEISILKYLMRSTFKPSPFSSLTSVLLCEINTDIKNAYCLVDNAQNKIKSYTRLNSKFYIEARKFILSSKTIYTAFPIKLNNSYELIEGGNKYKFFINKGNYEFFTYMENNDVLRLIVAYLNKNNSSFSELAEHCLKLVSATKEAMVEYIHKLLLSGFIELNLEFSGIDINWDEKLLSLLKTMAKTDERLILTSFIEKLIKYKNNFSESFLNNPQRKKIIDQSTLMIHKHFKEFNKLNKKKENYGKFDFELEKTHIRNNFFFEDTKLNGKVLLNKNKLQKHLNNITKLYDLSYSYSLEKKRPLLSFFKKKYNLKKKISLLELYEDYYSYLKKVKKEKTANIDIDLNQIEIDYIANEELVDFKLKNIYQNKIRHNYSCGMNFMYLGQNSIVVNALTWGYGRTTNRFLYMFDDKVLEKQKELNEKLNQYGTNSILYSEITDSSFFNANIHEPVFNLECIIPGGNTNSKQVNRLNVFQLEVLYDNKSDQLKLIDSKTGNEIITQDSCLQGTKGRSELYSLLLNFSDRITPNHFSIIKQINQKFIKNLNPNLLFYPRISYCKDIILQRKFWLIKKAGFPAIDKVKSNSYNFIVINKWASKNKIPSRIFMTINFMRTQKEDYRRDDYKPLFIDFKNPIFTNLLISILSKYETIQITEYLPNSPDSLLNGKTSEFVVQWYNGSDYDV